jgi:hypothetical protein
MVLPSPSGANACTTGQPTMNIDIPDGKPYFVDFAGNYYLRITRAGSLYEKLAALEALTNTEAQFFGVDTFADSNRYSINYYRVFKDEMLNLFSGVIRNDPSTYGGYVAGTQYNATPVVDLNIWGKATYDMPVYMLPTTKRVDSPINKTIEYYALGLALSQLDNTWDSSLDISNYLLVTQKGAVDDTTFTVPVHEFTHPVSGITYRAPQFDDKHVGVGVQVIDDLNVLVGKPGVNGTMPGSYGTYGYTNSDTTVAQTAIPDWNTAKAALDAAKASGNAAAYNNANSAFLAADFWLSYKVDLLNDLRNFRKAFGY